MEKKLKPFDLEAALKGAKVVTRGGFPARIICTDRKGYNQPVIFLLNSGNIETSHACSLNGKYYFYDGDEESKHDLFMAPVKTKYFGFVIRNRFGEIKTKINTFGKLALDSCDIVIHKFEFEVE